MHIAVASTFRDAEPYLDRYLDQAAKLRHALLRRGDEVTFVWGQNDSVDKTQRILERFHGDRIVIDCSTGAPYYPSIDLPARWANVASYCNATLAVVPPCDVLVWVEADLEWETETVLSIIDRAPELGVVGVPMWQGNHFYDTWSYRKDGEPFEPTRNSGMVHVDSACGLLAVRWDLAQGKMPTEDACRGWTREMGGVWVDTGLVVRHP